MPKHTEEETAMPLDTDGPPPEAAGKSSDINDEFDLESCRIDESTLAAATREQVSVPVDKPKKHTFVRVHPVESFFASLYKEPNGTLFLVTANVAKDPRVAEHVEPNQLVPFIDRDGYLRVWPLRQVRNGEKSNGAWDSAPLAAAAAKRRWVRVQYSFALGAYDVYEAPVQPPEPTWPDRPIGELVKLAFVGRVINSLEHPVMQKLLGTH